VIARKVLIAAVGALLLAGCSEKPQPVDPAHYDAFFLWPGVKPPKAMLRARTAYLLAGEVRARERGYTLLRPGIPRARHAAIWMVVRAERLDWEEGVYARILTDLDQWRGRGVPLVGLQVDFDAKTRGLEGYRRFLTDLRERLPERYRLSITGLMDWSAQGDPQALARLAGVVDEVVIQTYQGRRTIPGYERYMASLKRLPLPYKVGLVQNGEWQAPKSLADDPEFRGYVVFLLP
jgi:hypothetical protein